MIKDHLLLFHKPLEGEAEDVAEEIDHHHEQKEIRPPDDKKVMPVPLVPKDPLVMKVNNNKTTSPVENDLLVEKEINPPKTRINLVVANDPHERKEINQEDLAKIVLPVITLTVKKILNHIENEEILMAQEITTITKTLVKDDLVKTAHLAADEAAAEAEEEVSMLTEHLLKTDTTSLKVLLSKLKRNNTDPQEEFVKTS